MRYLTRIAVVTVLPLVAHSHQAGGDSKDGSHLRRNLQQEANTTLSRVPTYSSGNSSSLRTRTLGTGNCGGGSIGNAVCPDSSLCCSKYGWCGTGSAYCGSNQATATPVSSPIASPTAGTCGNGKIGDGRCSGGLCCSKYGYCGSGSAYCGSNQAPTKPPVSTPVAPVKAPIATPTSISQEKVLYSGSGSGTYYYDVTGKTCNGEAPYQETNGYPSCTSYDPAFYKTVQQYGSNNLVAIDDVILNRDRAGLCGKQIHIYKNGVEVSGGPFFVFDGCGACVGGGKIDFSVSALQAISGGTACRDGVVPGISWKVTNTQIVPFVP